MENIYLVKQTQYDENYIEKTIKVFTTEVEALKCKDNLNKEYEVEGEHFYEVEEMILENLYNNN